MKNKFYIGEEVKLLLSLGRCFSIALLPELGKTEYTSIKAKVVEVNVTMYNKGCFNTDCISGDCQISYSVELEGIPNKRFRVFEFELEKISDEEQEDYDYEISEVVTIGEGLSGRVGGIRKNNKGEIEYYIFCEESDKKWYSAKAIKKEGIKSGNA